MPSTQTRWGSKPARPLAVTETSTTFTVASQDHAPASNTRAESKHDATITTTDNGRGSNMYIPTVGDARHHTPLDRFSKLGVSRTRYDSHPKRHAFGKLSARPDIPSYHHPLLWLPTLFLL